LERLRESLFVTLSCKAHIGVKEDYELHPFAQSGIVSMVALILCFFPMISEYSFAKLAELPVSGWIALVWYGSIVTVIAFACMFTGAKYCNGYIIAAFNGLIPISSLVLSIIVLNETLKFNQVIGCFFILASIISISRPTGKPAALGL